MIELPEARTIAQQMQAELVGRRIAHAVRGASPHRFAFYGALDEAAYVSRLTGATVQACTAYGAHPILWLSGEHVLVLGGGGERILYHADERTLPRKHQLLLRLEDGAALSVTISGWGAVFVLTPEELVGHRHIRYGRAEPLTPAFTFEQFAAPLLARAPEDKTSLKYHLISEPGVVGLGNGYLQDILFHAGLHPKRRAATLGERERHKLYGALLSTLQRATELGGRDSERDLYNRAGGYTRLMDANTVGQPCPRCGAPIHKLSFLGGTCYLCDACQE